MRIGKVMWTLDDKGAATVSRLHSDPGFQTDLDAAKQEVKNLKAAGGRAPIDCSAEATAF